MNSNIIHGNSLSVCKIVLRYLLYRSCHSVLFVVEWWIFTDARRAPQEVYPEGFPSRKWRLLSSFEIWAVWGTHFLLVFYPSWTFWELLLVKWHICLQLSNKLLLAMNILGWLEKEKKHFIWLGKVKTFFQNINV